MTVISIAAAGRSQASRPASCPDPMNSVLGKVQLIIEAFTAEDISLSLADLVRRTGVAKASLYRLAQELVEWGLLERDGCNYRLGLRLFEIGQRVPRQRILREVVLPYMDDLLRTTQETIHFAIHDGLEVLYIEKILAHRGLSEQSRVAGRLPLYCTATGKVVLAFASNSLFTEVVRSGLKPLTRHTITSPARLRAQIDRVRIEQFAVEAEETRLGYMSAAVPVFGRDSVFVGALSVTGPTYRMDPAKLSGALRTAGMGVTRSLGRVL